MYARKKFVTMITIDNSNSYIKAKCMVIVLCFPLKDFTFMYLYIVLH